MSSASTVARVLLRTCGLLLFVAVTSTGSVHAQSPAPLVPLYGFDSTDFIIGGWTHTWPDSCTGDSCFGRLWQLADRLGMTFLRPQLPLNAIAVLADPTNPHKRPEHKLLVVPPLAYNAGFGMELEFFTFDREGGGDTTNNPYHRWRFVMRSGGVNDTNAIMVDTAVLGTSDPKMKERRYDSTNTTPSAVVAEGLSIASDEDGKIGKELTTEAFFTTWRRRSFTNQGTRTFYVTVRAHLGANNPLLPDADSLLAVEVWHDIDSGRRYLKASATDTAVAQSDTAILVKTVYVTRGELREGITAIPPVPVSEYRPVSLPVDLRSRVGSLPGPLHPNQPNWENGGGGSMKLNLKLRWLGGEPVAVRSVALRDSMAEMTLGNGSNALSFRAALLASFNVWLRGDSAGTLPVRSAIVKIAPGVEHNAFNHACYTAVDKFLLQFFDDDADGRTVNGFSDEAVENLSNLRALHHVGYRQSVLPEISIPTKITGPASLNIPATDSVIPAVLEHNAGRAWTPPIPILDLTDAGVEDYTTRLQRGIIGRYQPEDTRWPQKLGISYILGTAAAVSRITGARLIPTIFVGSGVAFNLAGAGTIGNPWRIDTAIGRHPEASELRLMMTLSLCYGARGFWHFWVGSYDNNLQSAGVGGLWTSFEPVDWGTMGRHFNDTFDHAPSYQFFDRYEVPHITVNNFYTGWGTRTRELISTHRWAQQIAPSLMKLRWRDGYSVHYTVPTPGVTSDSARPISASAIVSSVAAWDRYGRKDSTYRTFIEVGLFDSIPGAGGYDTNYIAVVNRRTFERPSDVSDTSARGKMMDSLSEWRRVDVRLNLRHPADASVYTFAHITEINPDTARAPWMTGPRPGLDTMVAVGAGIDSTFSLWMRPGGGALLRVTYVNPDPTLVLGDLRYNNARHAMWDGRRWHLVYAELDGDDATSYVDRIIWRWSEPCDSVITDVRWQGSRTLSMPNPDLVACDSVSISRWQNRHPSLAVLRIGDTARVTVTWTCHLPSWIPPGGTDREIVARSMLLVDTGTTGGALQTMGSLNTVDYYGGSWTAPWGTPVVSMWNGGECFSWSDSILGIMAKLRLNAVQWTNCAPDIWSAPLPVAITNGYSTIPGGQFPTMAPLAHVNARDSSNGLAWQQPVGGGQNSILYSRLVQTPAAGFPAVPGLVVGNFFMVNDQLGSGQFYHPSIDLWQHPYDQCMEGITWEEKGGLDPRLWYRSLNTIISYYTAPDTIRPVSGWAYHSQWLPPDTVTGLPYSWLWPSIGALNEAWDSATALDDAHMGIVFEDSVQSYNPATYSGHRLWETQVYFGYSTVKSGFPKLYSFDGSHPAITASQTRQAERAATVYEEPFALNTRQLTTTRQFFARTARPRGYLAVGRELVALDSGRAGAAAGVMDVWVGDDDSTRALGMTERDTTTRFIDTLAVAEGLLRSGSFTTHDSAVIGLRATARFIGDSTSAASRGVAIRLRWELVEELGGSVVAVLDSATVDAAHPRHDSSLAVVLDLVSGNYHVRMSADTVSFTARPLVASGSRWPVVETSMWVENNLAAKAVRTGEAKGARVRLDVQPNPASDHAEVMLSVPEDVAVRVTLYTVEGRSVGTVYAGTLERGRYSLPCAVGNLAAGTYIVKLVAGRERLVKQLIVR